MAGRKTKYAGIYRREGVRGVRYDAYYRDHTGKQRVKTFTTMAEARAFKQSTEVAVREGGYVDLTDKVTVADYARQYVDSRAHEQRAGTRERQLSMVRHHIAGTALGAMPLAKVRRENVDAWLIERASVLSRSTLRTHASLLRSVFRYAVENNRLRLAPIVVVPRATRRDIEVYAPTVSEVRSLTASMPERERAMVLVQFGLGLRVSEMLALRPCDVSPQFRTVKIDGQLSRAGQRVETKTDTSSRTLPMSGMVADAIREHLARFPVEEQGDYLFRNRRGRPYGHAYYSTVFKHAVRAARLPESLTTHALRHGYATALLRAGLSPVAVGRLLGHADGALVVRLYAHYLPADDDLARQALDAAWAGRSGARLAVTC